MPSVLRRSGPDFERDGVTVTPRALVSFCEDCQAPNAPFLINVGGKLLSYCGFVNRTPVCVGKGKQMPDPVFVFGSNLAGRHGKGAALWARQHRGAVYGQGQGLQGNSYAIPTKDAQLQTLPLSAIEAHVVAFVEYALAHPEMEFQLTPVGCGLAGYRPEEIAPLFDAPIPGNVIVPDEFKPFLIPVDPSP